MTLTSNMVADKEKKMKNGSFVYDKACNRYLTVIGTCLDPSVVSCSMQEKTAKGFQMTGNTVIPVTKLRSIIQESTKDLMNKINDGSIQVRWAGWFATENTSGRDLYDLIRNGRLIGTAEIGPEGLSIKIDEQFLIRDLRDDVTHDYSHKIISAFERDDKAVASANPNKTHDIERKDIVQDIEIELD